jgi:hypothetical protein
MMDRDAALLELEPMASRLEAWLGACAPDRLRLRPTPTDFAPVEHLWHLADLEVEAYGVRLRRLRDESHPQLPDFAGDAEAQARHYLAKDPFEALRRFREARAANLAAFDALTESQWDHSGEQEGVGRVTLMELPARMAAHDLDHWSALRLALL